MPVRHQDIADIREQLRPSWEGQRKIATGYRARRLTVAELPRRLHVGNDGCERHAGRIPVRQPQPPVRVDKPLLAHGQPRELQIDLRIMHRR